MMIKMMWNNLADLMNRPMLLKPILKFVLRSTIKQKTYSLINLLGLSISILLISLIVQWLNYELSYDRFFPKHDRICRLTIESNNPGRLKYHFARMSFNIPIEKYVPDIESKVRFAPMRKTLLRTNSKKINSEKVFWVDQSVLDVFNLEFVSGLKNAALGHPRSIIISESFALKFFGSVDSIDKKIELLPEHHQEPMHFTVKGVFKDIAENSHIDFDVLAVFDDPEKYNNWAYTYVLLNENSSIDIVEEKILNLERNEWKKFAEYNKIHIQSIADIHLKSHKDRELKVNGNMRSVILMGAAALFLLIIALSNLLNLQFALLFKELKYISINRIYGAPLLSIYVTQFVKTLYLTFLSVIISALLFWLLLPYMNSIDWLKTEFINYESEYLILSASVIALIVIIAGSLPVAVFAVRRISSGVFFKQKSGVLELFKPAQNFALRKVLLFVQFSVSLVLIICSIIIWKQMDLVQQNKLFPRNDKVLVLKHVNSQTRPKYAYLKQELSSLACVKSVSASLEAPPDQILDAVGFELNGQSKLNETESLYLNIVDDNYFDFYNQYILAGDDFPRYNKDLETAHYVLNESAVKALGFNDYNEVLGKSFSLKHQMIPFKEGKIGGIVKDFHYSSLHHKIGPMVFVQWPDFYLSYFIKIDSTNSAKSIADIERVWTNVHPNFPFEYTFSDQLYKYAYQHEYLQKELSSTFSILTLLLSIIGLLGIVSIVANQQRKELGIRKVLGATNWTLLRHSTSSYLKILFASVVLAAIASYYLMQEWLNNFSKRIDLLSNWWFVLIVMLILAFVILLIVSLKTILTSQFNPVENLRYE